MLLQFPKNPSQVEGVFYHYTLFRFGKVFYRLYQLPDFIINFRLNGSGIRF
jgi:hypothetical protein